MRFEIHKAIKQKKVIYHFFHEYLDTHKFLFPAVLIVSGLAIA